MKKVTKIGIMLGVFFAIVACGELANDNSYKKNTSVNEINLDYVFDLSVLSEITIEISSNEWNTLLTNFDRNPKNDLYVHADFKFTKNGETDILTNVAFRVRGNTSRERPEGYYSVLHNPTSPNWHHAHFKLNFKKFVDSRHFYGLRRMNLKWAKYDGTYIRETYGYDLLRRFGVWTAPRASYTRLNIKVKEDVSSAYFGVYYMIENIDQSLVEARFTDNTDGYVWKGLWQMDRASFEPSSKDGIGIKDVNNLNESLSYRPAYDLKTHQFDFTNIAKPQLESFIDGLATADRTWLEANIDIDLFLRFLAVNTLLGMWDSYWVDYNNFYCYFDNAGKFYFIPYDYDNSLGTSMSNVGYCNFGNAGTADVFNWGMSNGSTPLVEKILAISDFKKTYSNYLVQLVDENSDYFSFTKSTNRIHKWHNLISSYIANDTYEDNVIVDVPASWADEHYYRVLGGEPMQLGSATTNYIKTRIISAQQQLGIAATDWGDTVHSPTFDIQFIGLTIQANGYYIVYSTHTNISILIESTNPVTLLNCSSPGATNITDPPNSNYIDMWFTDPNNITAVNRKNLQVTVFDNIGSSYSTVAKIHQFRNDYISPEFTGGNVIFRWKGNPGSSSLYVKGDFNVWTNTNWLMTNVSGDLYAFETNATAVSAGQLYKFNYDNQWLADPANTNMQGSGDYNSIVP